MVLDDKLMAENRRPFLVVWSSQHSDPALVENSLHLFNGGTIESRLLSKLQYSYLGLGHRKFDVFVTYFMLRPVQFDTWHPNHAPSLEPARLAAGMPYPWHG